MDKATAKQTNLKSKPHTLACKIKEIVEQGRLITSKPEALFLFKGMYKELRPYFTAFNEAWEKLTEMSMAGELAEEFPSDNDKKIQQLAEKYYYESCAIYEYHMNPTPTSVKVSPEANPANLNIPSCSILNDSHAVRARLPQINLPTFGGNQSDWQIFHDTFKSLIHEEPSLSKIEKFHFLISTLKGPALTLVKGVQLVASNYDQAWELLTDTYNDKRRLASGYLKNVLNFVPFKTKPTANSLKFFQSTVMESISSFKHLEIAQPEDFIIFLLVVRCLDPQTRREFELKYSGTDFPTYENLKDFIKSELRALEITSEDLGSSEGAKGPPLSSIKRSLFSDQGLVISSPSRKGTNNNPTQGSRIRCPVCKSSHTLYQCKTFKDASAQAKINYLRNWSGCTNCLSSNHLKGRCPSTRSCQLCNRRHHSWLHVNSSRLGGGETLLEADKSPVQPSAVTLSGMSSSGEVILGTALVQIKDARNRFQTIRLVADCGSQNSFITSSCIKRLGLSPGKRAPCISGIGQVKLPSPRGQVSCTLRPRCGGPEFHADAVVVEEVTGSLPHSAIPKEFHINLNAYYLADPTYWKPQSIDFLLGADLYFDIITGGPIQVRPNYPKLIPSILGHIVSGRCAHISPFSSATSLLTKSQSGISTIMSKFWELEAVPEEVPESAEDKACEHHFQSTHYRLPSGRFVVALPFKSTIDQLQSPTIQVQNRFKKLEYRLQRNPPLRKEYTNFMNEYVELGHMNIAPSTGKYLIPHHCVIKHDESSKLRVVFDASCKGSRGSLNCHLMTGPKLQRDIANIIMNFRIHRVALVADIVKMYRQVLIRSEDRVYQRILWRADPMQPVEEFELNTVTYGLSAAPYLAIRTLRQLAADDGERYPLAAQALLEDVYVDDIVSGAETIHEALQMKSQLISLLRQGGFELSKWKSNKQELLDSVHCEQPSFTLNPTDDYSGCKILGLQWLPSADAFSFLIQRPTSPSTKRGILSTIARIFDPLGYLAPVVFQAKTILQEVWLANRNWDEMLPEAIQHRWQTFADRLPVLSNVRIPRHMPSKDGSNFILGFADASQRGYAAVIYLHTRTSTTHHTYLLKSKTKLAPTKLSTIPRLELCAALLLSRLLCSCSQLTAKLSIEKTLLFTDSTVVLGWLSTPVHRLKAFVAHRVTEIMESTQSSSWNHIDSTSNPADCASRGLMPHELPSHQLWWSGPNWLSLPSTEWPQCHILSSPSDLPELKPLDSACLLTTPLFSLVDWISRSSSYLKIMRSLSIALRFINRARKIEIPSGPVTLREIQEANLVCIRLVQREFLPPLTAMQSSKPWKALSPFSDSRGLFRVGGRLHHAQLPYDAKHPIILPKCHFTRVLINHYHQAFLHIGPTSLRSMIQRRYYVASARRLIRSCTRHCMVCQRSNPKIQPPLMGSLPPCRLREGQVFQSVGVDLGGPFPLKESNRRKASVGKSYLCLFVCMVTKALHLEVVSSCSTEAFLAALNRFVSRRGRPQHIYSDCGTNFMGAASALKELKEWYQARNSQDEIQGFAASMDIEWRTIPPRAPHFGGLWEAGIKSAKSLLARNLVATPLTFEELSTLCCRVEAVLNSRPLCPLSEDLEDLDCLTPGHFLIGRALVAMPEKSLLDLKENTLGRWQLVQQRAQHFWTRWRLEYLNQLQQRRKWNSSTHNLRTGDLVILKDSSAPLATWPLARVISTHPGDDGVVRVATIRTSTGVYKRPVVKLVPINLPNESENL